MTYYVLQVHARDVNINENFGDIERQKEFGAVGIEVKKID